MPTPPLSKLSFRPRYQMGEFGNKLRTWDTWDQLMESSYQGKVTARGYKVRMGAQTHYAMEMADLRNGVWPEGLSKNECHFNETPPDDKLTIQGEIERIAANDGLTLTYSTIKGIPQREAINCRPNHHVTGSVAKAVLQHYLTPHSYEDLRELMEIYGEGDCVVEFSTFTVRVGHLPHRNTIIWEVRGY
jgi:hypothetical protein